MSQAPKFLLGGVNFKSNFLGLQTIKTAVYGMGETVIKVMPIIAIGYGVGKASTHYTKERDAFLDEADIAQRPAEVRRAHFWTCEGVMMLTLILSF